MNIHFATLATSRFWNNEALLLAKTLRTYGGELTQSPISVLFPEGDRLPPGTETGLNQNDAQVKEFSLPEEVSKFPLGIIPYAAAAAESDLMDQDGVLVWLLPDTLVLNPPVGFALPEDKALAFRPVHHQNIGSSFDQPVNDFWRMIYKHTAAPEERLFKMITCYREEIRPYFNAGILAVRPQLRILQQWAEVFGRTFQHPDFTPFYENKLYAIFMHQAILAGVILHRLTPDQMISLSESYNYPLHMHTNYPQEGKVTQLAELVTARYESKEELPGFLEAFVDRGLLKQVLEQ